MRTSIWTTLLFLRRPGTLDPLVGGNGRSPEWVAPPGMEGGGGGGAPELEVEEEVLRVAVQVLRVREADDEQGEPAAPQLPPPHGPSDPFLHRP